MQLDELARLRRDLPESWSVEGALMKDTVVVTVKGTYEGAAVWLSGRLDLVLRALKRMGLMPVAVPMPREVT